MSIFAKPLSQLTWPDVEELLTGNAVENVRLEFKRDKPGRDEILKKLSSFANTYGGQLVVGAEANSKDGRLMGLPGIPLENNYKQTIVQWCADGVTPFVDVDVSDAIPHPANGTVLYVMRVSESDLAPHFLNERKGIYVRTNEFSSRFEPRLADESELRHLFNRRQVVNDRRLALIERARRRFATLVTRQHKEKKIGSRFDLAIIPRFPAQQICDHALLNSVIRKELITWRQTSFPRSSSRHISQHESAIVSNPGHSFSMIEANVWGLLFYATEVSRETSGGLTGIHLNHFLGHLLAFLQHATQLISKLGYVGPLLVQMKMESICGVDWIYFDQMTRQMAGSELDDDVIFDLLTTTDELQQNRDEVAKNLLKYVFFALNWPDAVSSDDMLNLLIRLAYEYNFWK